MSKRRHGKVKRPLSYWLRHQREKCECGGYWFPHRRRGGRCYHNPRWSELYGVDAEPETTTTPE